MLLTEYASEISYGHQKLQSLSRLLFQKLSLYIYLPFIYSLLVHISIYIKDYFTYAFKLSTRNVISNLKKSKCDNIRQTDSPLSIARSVPTLNPFLWPWTKQQTKGNRVRCNPERGMMLLSLFINMCDLCKHHAC